MDISCDLCNGNSFEPIYEFNDWSLLECNNCGLRFGYSQNMSNYKNIYDKSYFNSENAKKIGYSNYSKSREIKLLTFEKFFKEIESIIPIGSHLDVGSAFGYSIEIAKRNGWYSEGVEISPYAVDISQKYINTKIHCTDFLSYSNRKQYNLITAWDVLEHLSSPNQFFSRVNLLLRKKGILALTTPLSNSLFAKLFGKKWFEYKWPEHKYYLNKKNLFSYCSRYNFKIINIKYAIKYKTLGDALFRWIGMYENNYKFQKYLRIIIPYSSFSEIFLIAQKTN